MAVAGLLLISLDCSISETHENKIFHQVTELSGEKAHNAQKSFEVWDLSSAVGQGGEIENHPAPEEDSGPEIENSPGA